MPLRRGMCDNLGEIYDFQTATEFKLIAGSKFPSLLSSSSANVAAKATS